MEQERKDTIIREIKYWKQHKLLPDHYCDFLLTLYTEGEDNNDLEIRPSPLAKIKAIYSLMTVHLLLLVTLIVIYFTDFSLLMQISIGVICIMVTLIIAKNFIQKNKGFAHLCFFIGAIILFLLMVHIAVTIFPDNRMAIAGTVLFNCIGWVFIGYKWSIKYFYIAGIAGIILFILFALLF